VRTETNVFSLQSDEDDVVPLHEPVTTTTGETVNSIVIPKGTLIVVPIHVLNTLETYWGEDSTAFKPERWSELESGIKEVPGRINELRGYRHLMTFFDGPKTCLGKGFALTEFKAR
jgi:cytochrome P450